MIWRKKRVEFFKHHLKKVLRLSINPRMPDCFMSCSADGTIRIFDIRIKYSNCESHTFDEYERRDEGRDILPQAYCGGRVSRTLEGNDCKDSLVLDYALDTLVKDKDLNSPALLFSVDFHPTDGYYFIVSSAYGDVRLFDLRKIIEYNPGVSYLNIYRNIENKFTGHEITGCVYSNDGSEIVATALKDFIYVFDSNRNFEKEYGLDYFTEDTEKNLEKLRKIGGDEEEKEEEDDDNEDNENILNKKKSKPSIKTYKHIYKGHRSSMTIKGVNFYGPNSEYVITGSDDQHVYIWDKETTELLTVLEGHSNVVNCTVGHPSQPLLATSGIDHQIKIWQNIGDYPDEEENNKRKSFISSCIEENNQPAQPSFRYCAQQWVIV